MTTYTNATLTLPDGQRVKLDSFKWSHSEREPATVEALRSFSGEIRFAPFYISADNWRDVVRCFPRVCWKCYDGRTRSHNRRCRYRGHGRSMEVT